MPIKPYRSEQAKEMRLQGIHSTHKPMPSWRNLIDDDHRRFAVTSQHLGNAHCAVLHNLRKNLNSILSLHHQRQRSKNLTIQFRNTEYQLQSYGKGYRLWGAGHDAVRRFCWFGEQVLPCGKTLA